MWDDECQREKVMDVKGNVKPEPESFDAPCSDSIEFNSRSRYNSAKQIPFQ